MSLKVAAAAAAAWLVAGAVTVRADQVTVTPPFSKLFQPQTGESAQPAPRPAPRIPLMPQLAPGTTQLRPHVACGTTVVPVDPRFDAAIRKPAPDKPRASVRAVTPPPCQK
jgi:hypothetical protein